MTAKHTKQELIAAIEQFLQYGEDGFRSSRIMCPEGGNCHLGYFSGSGFAASVLREHLEFLKSSEYLGDLFWRAYQKIPVTEENDELLVELLAVSELNIFNTTR